MKEFDNHKSAMQPPKLLPSKCGRVCYIDPDMITVSFSGSDVAVEAEVAVILSIAKPHVLEDDQSTQSEVGIARELRILDLASSQ